MCPAALLGDRASGKTTFLGALYAAQVHYGTGQEDNFRFFAPPKSLTIMKNIRERMMSGSFPDATLKDEMSSVTFTFGFRTLFGRIVRNSESQVLKAWRGIKFAAYDVSGEDVHEYIESGVASSPIIKQLLESFVVVILVDCSRMTMDHESQSFRQMVEYDGEIATLVSNFATYKVEEFERGKAAGRKPQVPTIYPAIVLTKADLVQPQTLHRLGLPPEIPAQHDSADRQKFCNELLRVFLPQTLAMLRGGKVAGVSFDRAEYFTSWIRTVRVEGGMAPAGKPKISIRPPAAGSPAEMEYSYDEYVAFIEHFRKISGKVADAEGADAQSVGAVA